METKRTHFKMYKSGRRWVFACAVMVALVGGGAVTAQADATDDTSSSTTTSSQIATASESTSTMSSVVSQSRVSATSQSSTPTAQENDSSTTQTSTATQTTETTTATIKATAKAKKTKATTHTTTAVVPGSRLSMALANTLKAKARNGVANKQQLGHTNALSSAATKARTAKATVASLLQKLADQTPATTTALTPYADSGIQAGGSVYDDFPDLDNLLGVSSVFHIFAREAELNAHTNGNVAVQNLIGNVNFGTKIIEELLDKDISYIQNLTNIAGSSFVSAGDTRENKVIFGDGIEVDISNPNRPMVNGVYIDHLLASEVYQDQNGQTYIDFDAEFAKLKALNESLANTASEATYSNSDFDDLNKRVIDVSTMTPNANNQIVINVTPDVLVGDTPLTISGLSPDADGTTVIINVDTGGQSDYTIKSQIKIIYSDGTERNNQETEDFGDNHLLWNFYDSTASDKQYGGTINVNAPFQGSVLAPSATVVANQNLDGNIIADKVIVNAETHRWDLQDNTDSEDEPEYEDVMTLPGIGVELPSIEEPNTEEPNTEEPNTEEPNTEEPNVEEPQTEEPGDEELTYEHEHPNLADEYEDDLIDFEEEGNTAAEETLLNKVDAAIAQAKAAGNQTLVAELQTVRGEILSALGLADGLPQTGEAHQGWLQVLGLVLAGSLLGTTIIRRKRQD
ncbi:collagen-binding domain-containing protein [Levilactobacillus brevis]|uniref:collagen-binding domain-containing protein n=1 Tax=Levilactobacillus brevis TaxID=1580 RepID=UPI000A204BEA|nr:collagen-binding domain-containing protein [Levilactobacillus brevis]ARN90800.1 Surface protein [Levilactobacillus brevis]ARN98426.1 Surface protein [Levilactobacillus brevis]